MEFILFIAVIGLIIWNFRLGSRIDKLEWLNQKQSTATKRNEISSKKEKATTEDTDLFPWEEESNTAPAMTAKKAVKPKPKKEFHLEEFLGKKFFAILGVTSIVLAIGFFSAWAFSNGYIGPKGRIAIGIIFSIIILGIGEFIRPKYPKFFDKVSAAGIGGLLITLYLARNYNFPDLDGHILNSTQAFWSYAITVAAGILLSLRYQARFLGSFSIVAGIVIPLLVNSEPNPIGLLMYLTVLTIAGFIISLHQKWPEILGFLFIGITGYLIGIYDLETTQARMALCKPGGDCPETLIWQNISPILFLAFTYGLSLLIGSGGILRSLKTKAVQKMDKMDAKSTFEVLLFILSIFTANLLGHEIFQDQNWNHFGFFVLAQGFGFFFLSELFKAKKLEVFQKLALAATLISIIFATIWEVSTENEFVLTLLLVLEGTLFCFAGRSTGEIIFRIFGRIAIMLAFFWVFQIEDFMQSTIAILATIGASLYSIGKPKQIWEKIWAVISIAITSAEILYWSFEKLDRLIPEMELFTFLIPVLWGIGMAYSVLKTKEEFSRIAGVIFITIVSIIGWERLADGLIFENAMILLLLLFGIFTILSSFFINEKDIPTNPNTQRVATIILLGLATIGVFVFGAEDLKEPVRTIFWIVWAGLLLGFGSQNKWPHFRYFGIGIFLFLIAKLYVVDVWGWETMVRFFAFFGLGIALLVISFFYAKKK